jgi:hypothetical protein
MKDEILWRFATKTIITSIVVIMAFIIIIMAFAIRDVKMMTYRQMKMTTEIVSQMTTQTLTIQALRSELKNKTNEINRTK